MQEQMFCCPYDGGHLTILKNSISCDLCNEQFPLQDNIPVFASKRGYWSNIPQDKMRKVIELSESTGNWRRVLIDQIPDCERHIAPLFRGDINAMLPISQNSVVLDAGSMWGGITLPLAALCNTIYAVDKTWESLRYLQVRARQESISNIIPVESSIARLPFESAKFDLIILNGVLEWLATEEDVVLERDWNNASDNVSGRPKADNPEVMQLNGLKELHRVLKDDGSIYIAIENRIGLQYLAGYPDDHVNIRFVSFLPRWLADFFTKKIKNHSYRTFLYSPSKLKRLVKRAGFQHVELYSSFPHYNIISRLVPFNDFDNLGYLPLDGGAPLDTVGKIKVALFGLGWRLVPNPLRKHLAPSITVIAGKTKSPIPEVVKTFFENEVIDHKNYSVVLVNNRFADETPTNFLLKDRAASTPEFFCKLTRNDQRQHLKHENAQLIKLNKLIKETSLAGTVPEVRFCGEINSREIQAANFERLKASEPKLLRGLLRVLNGGSIKWYLKHPVKLPVEFIWRRSSLSVVSDALTWLARFNDITSTTKVTNIQHLQRLLRVEVEGLEGVHLVQAKELLRSIDNVNIGKLYLVAEHGDFDLCNVFRKEDGSVFVVDFEHMEDECLPFFDLGNILFSSIAQQWKDSGKPGSLVEYFSNRGWNGVIKKCLKSYSVESGVSLDILEFLPGLAAIRQFTKVFQESRDPADYPLFDDDVFSALISWRLKLSD